MIMASLWTAGLLRNMNRKNKIIQVRMFFYNPASYVSGGADDKC